MRTPRLSITALRRERSVLAAPRNGSFRRPHRGAAVWPPGWRRGSGSRLSAPSRNGSALLRRRRGTPQITARHGPARSPAMRRPLLARKRAGRLPAFWRNGGRRHAADSSRLGTGHPVRLPVFAATGTGGAARRRCARTFSAPAKQAEAVWRARIPEAVKPFLAVEETSLRCPTCKAWQLPSLQCRRCKCDLSLVVAVHDQQRRLHAQVLRLLASGRHVEALEVARSRWALSPDPQAARLLAVCHLLLGQFRTAQELCDQARR